MTSSDINNAMKNSVDSVINENLETVFSDFNEFAKITQTPTSGEEFAQAFIGLYHHMVETSVISTIKALVELGLLTLDP